MAHRRWYTDKRGRHRPITGGAKKAAFATMPLTIVNKPSLQLPVGAALAKSTLENPVLLDYHKVATRQDVQDTAVKLAHKGRTVIVSSIGPIPESSHEFFNKNEIGVKNSDKGHLLESGQIHTFVDDKAHWRRKAKKEGVNKVFTPHEFVKKYG